MTRDGVHLPRSRVIAENSRVPALRCSPSAETQPEREAIRSRCRRFND